MNRSTFNRPSKIISGGQTGVDRAALDAAIYLSIVHGGCCPRGRLAEDGAIPDRYELIEMASSDYSVRTEQNVVDADGTLIVHRGPLRGGTFLTRQLAERHGKPWLTVDLNDPAPFDEVHRWLDTNRVKVLNVAGPRESQSPGIGQAAYDYLVALFSS